MPYDTLPEFLKALDAAGELKRITAPVDPVLEIAEIADRVSKSPDRDGNYAGTGGAAAAPFAGKSPLHRTAAINQALLFENVKGSSIPLAINTFGSYKRMHMALGCNSFDDLAGRIAELTRPEVPSGIMNKIKKGIDFLKIGSYVPKVRSGPGLCQEVVHTDTADLTQLPIIQCWPEDGGKYITFGQIVTRHPETNAGGGGAAISACTASSSLAPR